MRRSGDDWHLPDGVLPNDERWAGGGPGLQVGGYRLGVRLAMTSTGQFHAAQDASGHDVAIKLVDDELIEDPIAYTHKLDACASLSQPGLLAINEYRRKDHATLLVFPSLPVWTLADRIEQWGPLTPAEACAMLARLAAALAALHRLGVEHGGIEPRNVVMIDEDEICLADPGAGPDYREGPYCAPELRSRLSSGDPRSDIHALGVLLAYTLCGRPLCRADAIATEPAIPAAVREWILTMIAFDARRRPADALAIATALEHEAAHHRAQADGQSGEPTPMESPTLGDAVGEMVALPRSPVARDDRPQRFGARLLAAAATLAALVGLGVWAHSHGSQTAPPIPPATPGSTGAPVPASAGTAPATEDRCSPIRSVFVLVDDASRSQVPRLEALLSESGLSVIEREQIAAIEHELDLTARAMADPTGCLRLGRLLSGHLAVICNHLDQQALQLRVIEVETSRILAARVLETAAADLPQRIHAVVCDALAHLEAQGVVAWRAGAWRCDIGSEHGLQLDDTLWIDPPGPGDDAIAAVVSDVDRRGAVLAPSRELERDRSYRCEKGLP
ncbi:MAG: protein kinase domain-containing protein [Planctomycetota bacterium]